VENAARQPRCPKALCDRARRQRLRYLPSCGCISKFCLTCLGDRPTCMRDEECGECFEPLRAGEGRPFVDIVLD
jgi:hypothetical protein